MAKKIRLNNGEDAIVDDEDFNRLNQFTWGLTNERPSRRYFDAAENRYATKMMSREIYKLKTGAPATVRYLDRNGLNNQKQNLKTFEGRKNKVIEKSSRGFLWPRKIEAFKAFIEQRDDLKILGVDKIAVLDMMDTAYSVKWTFRKIELVYELDTEEYEVAKKFKPYLLKILRYYWDWEFKLILSAVTLVDNEADEVEGDEVEAEEVEADEVEAEEVEAEEVEAEEVEGDEVGGEVEGDEVGGEVDGGEVDGGEIGDEVEADEVEADEKVEKVEKPEIKIIPRAALPR